MQELLGHFPQGTIFTSTQRHTVRTSYYDNKTTSVQSEAIRAPARSVVIRANDMTHELAQGAAGQHGSGGGRACQVAAAAGHKQQGVLKASVAYVCCNVAQELEGLEAELTRIRAQQDDVSRLQQAAKRTLDALEKEEQGHRNRCRHAEKEVSVKMSNLQAKERRPSPMATRPELEASIAQHRDDVAALVKRIATALQADCRGLHTVTLLHLQLLERRAQFEARQGSLHEARAALKELEQARQRLEQLKQQEIQRRRCADSVLPSTTQQRLLNTVLHREFEGGQQMNSRDVDAFASLPDDVSELRNMAIELRGRADGIPVNAGVLQAYRQRARNIESLAAQHQSQESTLETLEVLCFG